jgi:catechol 2,3-dioxygenase-like lactoylglutathione lyase family enzyme
MAKAFYHFNINCTNIERSLVFYRALGFEVLIDHGVFSPDKEHEEGWGADIKQGKALTHAVLLRLGDAPQPLLNLIEWIDPKTGDRGAKFPEYVYRVGPGRIALITDDIQKDYEEGKAKGINFISKPTKLPARNTVVACMDPDGTMIELIEFDKTSDYYKVYMGTK